MVYGIVLPTYPMVRRDFPAALLQKHHGLGRTHQAQRCWPRQPGRQGGEAAHLPGGQGDGGQKRIGMDFGGDFGGHFNGIQWGLMGFQRDFHGTLMGFTNIDGILDGLTLVKISRKMVLWHDIPWYTPIIYVLSVNIDLLTGRHPQLVISLPKLCVEENICRQKLMTKESHKIARTLYRGEPPYEQVNWFISRPTTGRIFCSWCTYVRSLLIRLHGVTHLFANCPWIVCRFPSLSHYQLVSSQLSILQLWSTNNF